MRIPENYSLKKALLDQFENVAAKYSAEYGIPIDVFVNDESDEDSIDYSTLNRVYFEIDGHEFENVKELRKALRNKVFI